MADKGIQKNSAKACCAGIERYTETLLWYENPRFSEYTAVERNTTCGNARDKWFPMLGTFVCLSQRYGVYMACTY
jgi:hypothetical protein